ncbi:Arm DNA-binding domain-containing protein [Sphingomonas sp. IC-56]|uniref:Arm DNA-binding domain-containing protein n=1 Tax=Sphingomonas sp. IC-56 TaxID=2898529 RepID=UPI003FA692D6
MVESAEVRAQEYMIWDGDIAGFGVRLLPSGRRSYLVQYRVGTRSRRLTLGAHGVLTPDQA